MIKKNFLKISFLIIITTLLFNMNKLFCKNFMLGTLLPNNTNFNKILSGIKSSAKGTIKIVNLIETENKVDLILCYKNFLKRAEKLKKPIFLIVDYDIEVSQFFSKYVKKIIVIKPIRVEALKILEILRLARRIGVLVHNKIFLDSLKMLKNNKIKIYKVNNIGEVPYKLDKALKETDALIALPDKTIFNYFSTQFIFKKAILAGKPIITFSEKFLSLGAYAAIEADYFKEGFYLYKLIKNFFYKKSFAVKIYYPPCNCFKIIKNVNLSMR